ncbi:hypothetical protein FACS189414_4150 [Bacteroidia bacterium]|nr:hypothetical protein FACS189414_4150 [Bacteroidia bacterium]
MSETIVQIRPKQKVIFYIDGFNFYFGLRDKNWRKYYWLDMVGFFSSFLRSHQELVEVHYFSARPTNKDKSNRQDILFLANKMNPQFILHLGKYLKKDITCKNCGTVIHSFEEKETDVRIATNMLSDVYTNRCDVSILVSADSDLVPPIQAIRSINPNHKILVFFPPKRYSVNLANLCDSHKDLGGAGNIFNAHILPETIALPGGYVIQRPSKWI